MDKTKTSHRQKTSTSREKSTRIGDFEGVREHNPSKRLLDKKFVGAAILECLSNNDPRGVMEIIMLYLDTLNKTQLSAKSHIARSTLYHSLKGRNPTIKTLAKLVYAVAH